MAHTGATSIHNPVTPICVPLKAKKYVVLYKYKAIPKPAAMPTVRPYKNNALKFGFLSDSNICPTSDAISPSLNVCAGRGSADASRWVPKLETTIERNINIAPAVA